jgi:NAD-dependent DNA ligase
MTNPHPKNPPNSFETYQKAAAAYAAGKPVMTDDEFDKLEALVKAQGHPIAERLEGAGTKVKLPVPMTGLTKVQKGGKPPVPEQTCYATPKFDGVAALIQYKIGKPVKWFTRGKKGIGHDITRFIKFAPHRTDTFTGYMRFELIATRQLAIELGYANAQRLATACITSNEAHEALPRMTWIPLYPVIRDSNIGDVIGGAYRNWADDCNIVIPPRKVLHEWDSLPTVFSVLKDRAERLDLQTDGVVVFTNGVMHWSADTMHDNPDWAFAYKENAQGVDAKVKRIVWQTSPRGLLIPVVELTAPVVIDGVSIDRATAHNYKNVLDNGIGKGAIIRILRSGDVIPFIESVVTPAKPDLPTVQFTTSGVHAVNSEFDDTLENAPKIMRQCKMLGVEGIGEETAKQLADILNSKPNRPNLVEILLKPKWRTSLLSRVFSDAQLKNCKFPASVTLDKAYAATYLLPSGLGEKRIREKLLGKNLGPKMDVLYETAMKENAPSLSFIDSLVESGLVTTIEPDATPTIGIAVWTGYRDAKQEETAKNLGYSTGSSVSSKTSVLFVKSLTESSEKIRKAHQLGIPVCLFSEWKARQ